MAEYRYTEEEREVMARWEKEADDVRIVVAIAVAWAILLLSFAGWRDWQSFKARNLDKPALIEQTDN